MAILKEGVTVTGVKRLDYAMRTLEPKMQKKAIRKATRAAAKVLLAKVRASVPRDTGAMAEAFQVRATTKRVTKKTGEIRVAENKKTGDVYGYFVKKTIGQDFGAKTEITRKSLAKVTEKQVIRGKRKRITMESDEYFYPAIVELGTPNQSPNPTIRNAKDAVRSEALSVFRRELASFLSSENFIARSLTRGLG